MNLTGAQGLCAIEQTRIFPVKLQSPGEKLLNLSPSNLNGKVTSRILHPVECVNPDDPDSQTWEWILKFEKMRGGILKYEKV